jgi:hypothetical protein
MESVFIGHRYCRHVRGTVTFTDRDGWNWKFDLSFMLSNYQCIWGRGCPDTSNGGTARGCCVEGVEVYAGEGDEEGLDQLAAIRRRVRQLTDEDWQNRQVALRKGGRDPWAKARFKRGSAHTRIHRGACIFHNRPDHPAGAGCALHVAALRRGEDPLDWKPATCWQIPLFFEIDEDTSTTTVRAARTTDWGEEGVLNWWCTETDEPFSAAQPLYVGMEAELRRVCSDDVYDALAAHCRKREQARRARGPTPLPMARS